MNVKREKSALKMVRRFIVDHSDREAGQWLVTKERELAIFVENDFKELSADERLKFYGLMEGFFPKHFRRFLAARLAQERDTECLKVLEAISEMHPNPK